MPHSQKADLLRRRREWNASKKTATAVPFSGETIRFHRPAQNTRDYFSSIPLGYTQTGVVLVGTVDSSLPSSSSLNDNRENLFTTQSEYVTSVSYPTPASVPSQLSRGILIICFAINLLYFCSLIRTRSFAIRLILYSIQLSVPLHSMLFAYLFSVSNSSLKVILMSFEKLPIFHYKEEAFVFLLSAV